MTDIEQDVLTRIAFGEEEPGDREQLATILTRYPHAQAELDQLMVLCRDMGDLTAIPEPQISFQRVRHAIEAGAQVRPRWRFVGLGFGLAGAAAAAMILTWMAKPGAAIKTVPPQVAVHDAPTSHVETAMAEPTAEEVDALLHGMMDTDTTPASEGPRPILARHTPGTRRVTPARRSLRVVNLAKTTASEDRVAVTMAEDSAPVAALAAPAPAGSTSIVVVGARPDPETGAARAVESTDSSSIEFRG